MSIIFQSILGRRLVCLKSQKADANKAILLTATRPDFTSKSCWQLIAAPFTTCHFPRDAAADRGRSANENESNPSHPRFDIYVCQRPCQRME